MHHPHSQHKKKGGPIHSMWIDPPEERARMSACYFFVSENSRIVWIPVVPE